MSDANVFEIIDPGFGASFQDQGRNGWRRFGVPASGAMDDHAAAMANLLLNNPPNAPLVELLLHGAAFRVTNDCWIALCGAAHDASVTVWRATKVHAGETVRVQPLQRGVWSYLAVEGGFDAPCFFGSASVFTRGGIGSPLAQGDTLRRQLTSGFNLPTGVAGRRVADDERRDYSNPPPLRVWPGPQWDWISQIDRDSFFSRSWKVSPQSDRMGYRLLGEPLHPLRTEMLSEPTLDGTIQIPANGLPLVTMRDGPTVGGYPKLGVVDPADLSWLAQCRPGQEVRFRLVVEP